MPKKPPIIRRPSKLTDFRSFATLQRGEKLALIRVFRQSLHDIWRESCPWSDRRNRHRRRLTFEFVENRLLLAADIHSSDGLDIDGDGTVQIGVGGEGRAGEIRGRVWNDLDGSGTQESAEAGVPQWSVHLDLNNNGLIDQQRQSIVSADTPVDFIDLATITSRIHVSGLIRPITDVDVTLLIDHTWSADLDAFLVSPAGQRVELFSDVGGGGDNFSGTIFDDAADLSIAAGAAPFLGSFRPEAPLDVFAGEDANGDWTLEITDDFSADSGQLVSWTLHLTAETEPRVVTDARGDFAITQLRPGRYTVRQVSQGEWTQTYPSGNAAHSVVIDAGQVAHSVDFGSRAPQSRMGAIQGIVWEDANGDGVRQLVEAGLESHAVFLDLNANGSFDHGRVTVSATDLPQPFVDLETLTSQVTVSDFASPISDLNVTLTIDHTYDADLDAFLISPVGTRVELFTDVGGSGNRFSNTTLDDQADTALVSAWAPFVGSFRPEGRLSAFDGEDANGTWTLEITDDANLDTGQLLAWSLTVTDEGEPLRQTHDDGGYLFSELAPGEYSVKQVLGSDWDQTPPAPNVGYNLTVAAGQVLSGIDFGNRTRLTQIRGLLWNDLDGDGVRDEGEGGLSRRRLFIDENGNGVHDRQLVSRFSGDLHQPLADLTTTLSNLEVAGFAGPVSDVNVTLHIEHSWDTDLDVFLIGPTGTRVELFTDVGGSGDNFFDTTFDDQATRSVTSVVSPFISSMRPEGSLADFNGQDANGIWTLEITDDAEQDSGELIQWSLTLEGQRESHSITDTNGQYAFTDLVPGTYTIAQQLPAHWVQTAPVNGPWATEVDRGTAIQDVDFGSYNSQPSLQLLPDFSVLVDEDNGYLHGWSIDTTSQPARTLLRLSTAVANIGEGPVEIFGEEVNTDGAQNVFQRIYDSDDNFTDRLAGTFVFHSEHGHIHFDRYAEYRLRAVTPDHGLGDVVASGEKVSFCLLDSVAHDTALAGAPATPQYAGCGQVQGVSVGWADVYGLHLPDQWIDITDIANGHYWLEVVVDPENRLAEADETNNVGRVLIELDTVQAAASPLEPSARSMPPPIRPAAAGPSWAVN